MRLIPTCLALSLLMLGAAPSLQAASTAASSASEGGSLSVGSVSTSIRKSSDSSSRATGVAQGDYRIIEVAALPEQPGQVRMALQSQADASEQGSLYLYLPAQVVAKAELGAGQLVTATQQPYGIQFAKTETQQAFFLVLEDSVYRELPSRPVTL